MTIREIISVVMKRLHVSQPSPEHLDKGREAVKRFFKEYSANGTINTDLVPVTIATTDPYINELDDMGDYSTIVGALDGKRKLNLVDILTWYAHKDDEFYYALVQDSNGVFTLYHKVRNTITLICRKKADFDLDDELTLPEELEPLLELYILKEMARTSEQYARYQAEYEAMEQRVKDNRLTFVLPVRDIYEDYLNRRWLSDEN